MDSHLLEEVLEEKDLGSFHFW